MNFKKYLKSLVLLIIVFTITSCSALHTTISKRNLDVQTKMSDTIWLDPVAGDKTVFLQIRNTSGKNLTIENRIISKMQEKGYRVVGDPSMARYWLQANILKVDKVDLREVSPDTFSNVVLAGGIGAALGGTRSGGIYTAVGWGLAAATISTIADALVKDINYAMVTDILITEKTGKTVSVTTKNVVKQGTSGARTSTSSESTNVDKYSTRVLSIANKVNLKFEDAVPVLEEELVNVLSGIF
ncbi:MAG: complement resistance protein TraT [Fusobacterium sp.]|uniref:complement resistance protein TraT n=1 Tax=Fusobacterium sp. TaxID=68766 RepID=UPI0026DB3448|nr:complement resistance protein TraT [Fusobacterium sp.]MDO4690328.1 complement resistance protein TraT [Fusobacterium sp.]